MKKKILISVIMFCLVFILGFAKNTFATSVDYVNGTESENTVLYDSSANMTKEDTTTVASSTTVTNIDEQEREEGLSIASIINIFLIVVGVVLILLGIAIFFRVK